MTDNRTTELLQKIQSLLDERGAEYTVQDALIGWFLTVEHPTETWTYKIGIQTTGLIDIWGSHITPEQAIAAMLGGGECEFRPFKDEDWSEPNAVRGVCSECSALMYGKDNYCPNCGKAVKR